MTRPETRDAQSGVAEVLAEHHAAVGPVTGAWLCTCGTQSTNGHARTDDLTSKEERQAEYRAHLAAALGPLLAAERATALREAADLLHKEARWQTEMATREPAGTHRRFAAKTVAARMAMHERILRERADREQP